MLPIRNIRPQTDRHLNRPAATAPVALLCLWKNQLNSQFQKEINNNDSVVTNVTRPESPCKRSTTALHTTKHANLLQQIIRVQRDQVHNMLICYKL
eukprot:jgi/Psemu1/34950/gm1.34950_g